MRFTIPKVKVPNVSKWSVILWVLWIGFGLTSLLVPVGRWNKNKEGYYSTYGKYIAYQNAQRQYEQQNNNNNNNNYGYTYPTCKWYQSACRKSQYAFKQNYMNNNGDEQNAMAYTPSWYHFIGGRSDGDQDRRFYEEMGMSMSADTPTGTMRFVYTWSILMFVGLLAWGSYVIVTQKALGPLIVLLVVYAQFSLLNLLIIGQGAITTDNRDLEESVYGWYGQFSVLLVYAEFWYILHCLIFMVVFSGIALVHWWHARRNPKAASEGEGEEVEDNGDYTSPGVYKNMA